MANPSASFLSSHTGSWLSNGWDQSSPDWKALDNRETTVLAVAEVRQRIRDKAGKTNIGEDPEFEKKLNGAASLQGFFCGRSWRLKDDGPGQWEEVVSYDQVGYIPVRIHPKGKSDDGETDLSALLANRPTQRVLLSAKSGSGKTVAMINALLNTLRPDEMAPASEMGGMVPCFLAPQSVPEDHHALLTVAGPRRLELASQVAQFPHGPLKTPHPGHRVQFGLLPAVIPDQTVTLRTGGRLVADGVASVRPKKGDFLRFPGVQTPSRGRR